MFEGLFRYYLAGSGAWQWWVGTTFGGVVVNDSWSTSADRDPYADTAFVGPRAITLATEGLAVGFGARTFADGIDAVYYVAQENYPIEFAEMEFGVEIERFGIHRNSGGPGRWRGGCGGILKGCDEGWVGRCAPSLLFYDPGEVAGTRHWRHTAGEIFAAVSGAELTLVPIACDADDVRRVQRNFKLF